MTIVAVPSTLIEPVGELEGMTLLEWDMQDEPARGSEIEVVVAPPFSASWMTRLRELPRLRALQLCTAGHEHALRFLPEGVSLANAVGVHDTATAEMALTLILAAQRDVPDFVRAQQSGRWATPQTRRSLADSTVLILGYGGIGQALAARLRSSEAQVLAVASRARAGDDLVETVYAVSDLPEMLPRSDVVCVAAPLTESTRGLLNEESLALLPDDALVVNVGRGPVVDTGALLAECTAGRLRAALDVTDPEPLPAEHPLWTTPGVLISPHTGGNTVAFTPRMARYLRSQLTTYRERGTLPHTVATG